jgi:hypothetical protein
MATGHKTGGRQAGTPNRLTLEFKSVLKDILYKELEQLPSRLDKLSDKERIELMLRLLPFIVPKVQASPFTTGEPIDSWISGF